MLFNYRIDSAGIFKELTYLKNVANYLLDNKTIAGLKNYNEHKLNEFLIVNRKNKIDTIALGSSRIMLLRKTHLSLEGRPFFNHGLSGAVIEDYIAILGIYKKKKGYIPKNVIISVDPWIFNVNNDNLNWKRLINYYSYLFKKIRNTEYENSTSINKKYLQLINYEYSISNIDKIYSNKIDYYITDSVNIDDSLISSDGSIYYPFDVRYPNIDDIKKNAINAGTYNVYRFKYFNKMSNKKLFKSLIYYLKENNINVTFVLFPYNPITYDLLINNPKYDIIVDVEDFLIDYAKKENIQLLGSYNPYINDFKVNDFSDGMHSLESVVKDLFSNYKKGKVK